MKFVLYLISSHFCVCMSHKDTNPNPILRDVHKEFTDEKLKPKVQIEDGFIYIMN